MKCIVGLGNIGNEYAHTRHNVGFDVLDIIASKKNLTFNEAKQFKASIATSNENGEKVLWVKPSTYMNLSGQAVSAIVNYYKIDNLDILIIHDDLDLPIGKIRLRESGSAGGQKGMANIIQLLGDCNLRRIRVGIGKDSNIPVVDYVLGKFKVDDKESILDAFNASANAAIEFASGKEFSRIMNRYNSK